MFTDWSQISFVISRDGLTALHCAAARGHTEALETLVGLCGARVDVADSHGCTPLHYAAALGHADATSALLVHGADAHRQDRRGRSPAHTAAAKGQIETVRILGKLNDVSCEIDFYIIYNLIIEKN